MRVETLEKLSENNDLRDTTQNEISNDSTTFQTGSRMVEHALNLALIDYDFIDSYKMEIINGRNFDKNMGTDLEEGVLINEAAAKELGWGDDAIGKKIDFGIELDGTADRYTKVIGVIKNFNYNSLHNKIDPMLFFLSESPRYFLSIRIDEKNRQQALEFIEEKWYEFGAINPFDYDFLDQNLDEMYEAEVNIGRIFRIASLLSIFIALLGLLGLSSFIAEQRSKEIGIRKVLGASVSSIIIKLFKEFIVLIMVAFVIAAPLSWWGLTDWLNSSFIYNVGIGWLTFVIAILLAVIIGLATTSFHIIKAANANPVDSIKCE